MRTNVFWHSLRFKITFGLFVLLSIAFTATFFLRYASYRQLVMANHELASARTGEIIEGSLLYSMLTHDTETVQQILAHIIEQEQGIEQLILLNREGRVAAVAGGTVAEGQAVAEATCHACHEGPEASWNESLVLTSRGTDVLCNVNAVANSVACQACHDASSQITGVLISDYSIASVGAELAHYRRSRILISLGSSLLILLAGNLMMSRIVVVRLKRFLGVVKQIAVGNLDARVVAENSDEISELAQAFNEMADGLKEKQRLEQEVRTRTGELQAQTEQLSALNTLAETVSQSLNLRQVLHTALDQVLELMHLRACWILLCDEQRKGLGPTAYRGMENVVTLAQIECAWHRQIDPPSVEDGLAVAPSNGGDGSCPAAAHFRDASRARVFIHDACQCPVTERLSAADSTFRACVPLQSKDRVEGIMTLIGDELSGLHEPSQNSRAILTAMGRQIGIAVENASLYEELQAKETLRRQLLQKVISVQEDERRRISRELHDQTGQILTSLIVTLKVLEKASSPAEIRSHIQMVRDTAAQALQEVHSLALELRPSVLDDLGLLAALRHCIVKYRQRFRLLIDFEAIGFEEERLPPTVETALYRIVQEALMNVAHHAQAQNASVVLEHQESHVRLIVEDDGKGFDVAAVMESHVGEENLGLHGMRERASLLDGTLTIESTPGIGTTVFVEIPLASGGNGDGQD